MENNHQSFAAAGAESTDWKVEVDLIPDAEWSFELEKFEDANVYQTAAYGEVSWGKRQLSRVVLKRGGEVVGLAQLRVVKVPLLGRGIAYLRSGPIWRRRGQPWDRGILERLLAALKAEYVRRRKLLLRIIPSVFTDDPAENLYRGCLEGSGLKCASNNSSCYQTILLDISLPPEQLRKNLDQKWRNQLNRAERNNLSIVEGTDERLYGMFKGIYTEMMDRKGFETSVDIHEFERIQNRLPESQKIRIAIALKDEKPVSAVLSSSIGDTGIYLLGATSNEGMQHKGSYLLQWRMIQTLKEQGCRCYDLGGINRERNPGVYHFKSGFSGREASQIGAFELSGSWLSSAIVSFGEQRQRRRNRASAPTDAAAAPVIAPSPSAGQSSHAAPAPVQVTTSTAATQ